MAANKFAVIGLGRFGTSIARALSKNGAEVLAIDLDQERVDVVSADVAYAIALDAIDKKALASQNLQDFDGVVVAIGNDFEHLLLSVVALQELGIKRIIARASGRRQRIILEKLGITEIFQPEEEVGTLVAERLINPSLVSYLQLPDEYRIAEIKTPKNIIGKTVEEVRFRDKYHISLVTLKHVEEILKDTEMYSEHHIKGVPGSQTIIQEQDFLVVFGKEPDIERFIEVNS
ncbi:MAG: potassium channel family protein [Bacteroidales bacterium]|nr:TrkA family potassium uptake protein [Bacteroidales bacterium]HQK36075.1 TrkA family potassium uptake protein [Bacteroidales bacterium]